MSKLLVTEFMTLDGIMEAPEKWSFPFWNDEAAKFKRDELFATGALLLGRVTYDSFATAWRSRADKEGFTDCMNSLPKYVVSTTLNELQSLLSLIPWSRKNETVGFVTQAFCTEGERNV